MTCAAYVIKAREIHISQESEKNSAPHRRIFRRAAALGGSAQPRREPFNPLLRAISRTINADEHRYGNSRLHKNRIKLVG